MNPEKRVIAVISILLATALATAAGDTLSASTYRISPAGSQISFHAKATFMKIVGVFHDWHADLRMPSGNVEETSLSLEIQAESVKTGSGLKDKEVKGQKFFDVENHPTIRFVSTRVLAGSDPSRFLMEGDLTLRGVTKPVSVILTWQPGENGDRRLRGDCEFNRREFGMVHNVPFNKVADKVGVIFDFDISNAPTVPAHPATAHNGPDQVKRAATRTAATAAPASFIQRTSGR
ncbi:MAG TPA: YceI family protein [Candidatus Aquilonibacter sp.]|nr:YceI family protein [Candidatus Aquilonibacter sp.]